MQIIHHIHCSKCKATDKPLVKYAKSKTGSIQYYYCRDCNNEKFKMYYVKNAEKVRNIIYKSTIKHIHKQAARLVLNKQVNSGKIERPKTCSTCGKEGKIQGHHSDYTKPLEVIWLCSGCHADADRFNEQLKGAIIYQL